MARMKRGLLGGPVGVLVGVLVAGVSASPVSAQESLLDAGTRLLSVVVGQQSFDLEGEEDGGAELDDAIVVGGGFLRAFNRRWGVEGLVQFSRPTAELDLEADDNGADAGEADDGEDDDGSDDGEDGVDGGSRVTATYYTAAITYNVVAGRRWVPFVTVGGGGVTLNVAGGGTDTKPAGMVGAGILYRLTDRILLRGDVRDYLYSVGGLGVASRTALGLGDGTESRVNDVSWTGGVSWRF